MGHLVKSTENVNISKYMTGSTYSEARFGILDEFLILEVYPFPLAIYHPTIFGSGAGGKEATTTTLRT
jgi:hypothetical protein